MILINKESSINQVCFNIILKTRERNQRLQFILLNEILLRFLLLLYKRNTSHKRFGIEILLPLLI